MNPTKDPEPKLRPTALYLGDGGVCFCGRHAGMTAQYTGRDISGQRVLRIDTRGDLTISADGRISVVIDGETLACETCAEVRS